MVRGPLYRTELAGSTPNLFCQLRPRYLVYRPLIDYIQASMLRPGSAATNAPNVCIVGSSIMPASYSCSAKFLRPRRGVGCWLACSPISPVWAKTAGAIQSAIRRLQGTSWCGRMYAGRCDDCDRVNGMFGLCCNERDCGSGRRSILRPISTTVERRYVLHHRGGGVMERDITPTIATRAEVRSPVEERHAPTDVQRYGFAAEFIRSLQSAARPKSRPGR